MHNHLKLSSLNSYKALMEYFLYKSKRNLNRYYFMKKLVTIILLCLSGMLFVNAAYAQNNEKVEGVIFSYVDTKPEFVGGRDALIEFITTHMEFPKKANGKGKVYLEFIVKADGGIANIKVSKTSDKAFNKEAIRLVSLMPKWKPGVLNGNNVNSRYEFPIKFGYDCVLDTK